MSKEKSNKLIVVTGPTASGKSSLAIKLAKKYNGEIISADSRQVYKKMDIGTSKIKNKKPKGRTKREKKLGKCLAEGVTHYLIDVADPRNEVFNMSKFQNLTYDAIELIQSKNKLPFVAGGTMLYIDSVVKGYQTPEGRDKKLRNNLKRKSNQELARQLKEIDPESYKKIDKNNRHRLIRAMEVKKLTGEGFFESQKQIKPDFETLKLVIKLSRKKLYDRIDERVEKRISLGMIQEIEKLKDWGLSNDRMRKVAFDYRFGLKYLSGQIGKDEMIEEIKNKIHSYARRQLTWWRGDEKATWISDFKEAHKKIKDFLGK